MITAAGSDGERPMVFLGIDGENVTRLVAGEPIRAVVPADNRCGLPEMTVILHYRKTLDELLADVQRLMR